MQFRLALLLLLPALAGAAELKYEKYSLGNGLEVIIHEDHRLPLVAVNIWYHVGPANETAGRTGFAHLFEHMMFEGSKHIGSKAHFRYLEAAGASDINGTTDFDRTNYYETLPSNQLELALWLESDRMGYLLDGLDAEKLANQRDVVRNERRQSTEGAPYGLVEEALFQALYPKGHPYHAVVIGSHADIEAAKLADVRNFSRGYYTPNNASLVIAGDVDSKAVRALVEHYFASIPRGPAIAAPEASVPVITSELRSVVTDQVELARIYMGWVTDPLYKPGDAEADLIAQILGGGRSSRLYKRLVRELELAQDVAVTNQNYRFGSAFELTATVKKGVDPAKLEAAIDAEMKRFRDLGPTAPELARARNQIETRTLVGLERLGGVADTLNRYNQFLSDPGYLGRDLARYQAASAKDLMRVAAARLRPEQRAIVTGIPGAKVVDDVARAAQEPAGESGGRMADESWRSAEPPAGPAPALQLPTPVRIELANGLAVLVLERHELPVVAATVIVGGGTLANPANRPGLAAFTAAMLEEGTKQRSADQIADDAATSGASVAVHDGRDATVAGMTVLHGNLPAAVELLADLVLHPKLDARDAERVRALREGEITLEDNDPAYMSRRLALFALYGPGHPYGYPDVGTVQGNQGIRAADVRGYWRARYHPESTALVLAGDVTAAEARGLALRHFGAWRSSGPAPALPKASFQPGRRLLLLDQPGAPQSMLRIAVAGAARATPDYAGLEVTNNVFGGLFSSRLNMNLREEHGYTYGSNARFRYAREPGYLSISSAVRTDVSAPALKEAMLEFGRMRELPPSAAEMALARGAAAQSLAGLFETSEGSAEAVGELYVYGLPLATYAELPARINAVTAGEVTLLAKRYFDAGAAKIVVVGDRAKILDGITALGLAPVEAVNRSGAPAPAAP
jgi:zinc protease